MEEVDESTAKFAEERQGEDMDFIRAWGERHVLNAIGKGAITEQKAGHPIGLVKNS